jgi:hypothetical protein
MDKVFSVNRSTSRKSDCELPVIFRECRGRAMGINLYLKIIGYLL